MTVGTQDLTLVRTKLHRPPASSDFVDCEKLFIKLNSNLDLPLTLISVPAGDGKSIIISHWLEIIALLGAWLTSDENDIDLRGFFTYFAAAVRNIFCIIAIWFLLGGCVKIPDRHGTVGKYNELRDMNTECLREDSILSLNASSTPQHIDELNSQGFMMLNWNSYKGSSKEWYDDLERLSRQTDLVVLQEGYLTDDLQDLLNKKKYNWDIAKAFTYYNTFTGVLTASTVKPDFLCSFRAFEPLSGIPKTVLITRYPLSGTDESLLLANIHMVNFSLDIAAYSSQLEKIAVILSQHRGPLIIAGDFNSWSSERMRTLSDVTQQLDVEAVTFDTDNRVTFMGRRVDHIYYRQLAPIEAFSEKVLTSDHNPMLVTFRLADDV